MSAGASESLLESDQFDLADASAAEIAARSPLELFWRRLRRDKVALVALTIVVVMTLVALFAPLLVKVLGLPDPNIQNDNLLGDFGQPTGPSGAHPLGVDTRGRDIAARVIYGARVSLEVAFVATAIIVVLGVTAGLITGYYRGKVDTLVSRVMDLFLAFPVLVLAVGLGVACADGCLGGTAAEDLHRLFQIGDVDAVGDEMGGADKRFDRLARNHAHRVDLALRGSSPERSGDVNRFDSVVAMKSF